MTPIRIPLIVTLCVGLAACGGGGSPGTPSVTRSYATGPIQTACLKADRKAATRALCGCVQAVANSTLNSREQSRAVRFFADPHEAQEVRQSDRRSDERLWTRYKAFVASARRSCG